MHKITENQMKFENLEQRVLAAREDTDELNDLIREYIPFIRKTAIRTIPPSEYDSFSTTAMEAFAEAVEKFRNTEGNFMSFASLVITNRIKDQIRREYKPGEIPSDEIEIEQSFEESEDRLMEVKMFREELIEYGIKLDSLVKESPKHKKTRLNANRAALTLANTAQLMEALLETKKLPIKKLSETSGITEKLIEQKRKYIIAKTLMNQDKYTYLKEYAK